MLTAPGDVRNKSAASSFSSSDATEPVSTTEFPSVETLMPPGALSRDDREIIACNSRCRLASGIGRMPAIRTGPPITTPRRPRAGPKVVEPVNRMPLVVVLLMLAVPLRPVRPLLLDADVPPNDPRLPLLEDPPNALLEPRPPAPDVPEVRLP